MVDEAASLTLTEVLERTVARVPRSLALLSDDRTLTWAELETEVAHVAGLLLAVGIRPGDVVGFLLDKRPEVVTGFLACARIGAIMAPVNFKLTHEQIRDQFQTSRVTAVVTQRSRDDILQQVLAFLPDLRRIVYVGGRSLDGTTRYEDWLAAPPAPIDPTITPDTVCYFNYTSGTTGRSKGAITTHRHILENAVATINGLGFTERDVFLGMFSVFAHPHELFHRSIVVGGPFAILDSLSPRRIAECVAQFKVTWMMAVPSFYEMMLDYAAVPGSVSSTASVAEGPDERHDLSSLRVLESGGAYVGPDVLQRMEQSFAGATFLPVWGCTEATGVALANGPGSWRKPGATGRPVPGYAVRVVNDAGADAAPGEVGEMLLQGAAVASGYVGQPEETAAAFAGGWYRTGDLVTLDEDGFVQFSGRRSEMLKIGGIRVYPLEIEQVLLQHPQVRCAVVVRAEERLRGEIARAIVEVEPGSALTGREVQAWCRDHLASYKVPRVVEFWRAIPRLPNGKIDKQAILAVPLDPARDER